MPESQYAEGAKQLASERVERARELSGEEPEVVVHGAAAPTFQGGRIDPRRLTPQAILVLQRTAGNHAVNELLRRQVSTRPTVQRRGPASGSSDGGTATGDAGTRSLADIERNYRDVSSSARATGSGVAWLCRLWQCKFPRCYPCQWSLVAPAGRCCRVACLCLSHWSVLAGRLCNPTGLIEK